MKLANVGILFLFPSCVSLAGIINWYGSNGNSGFATYNDGPGLIPTLMDLHQKGEEQELREKQFEAEQRAAKNRAKREAEQRAYRERVNALANSVASDLCEMFNEINRVEAWNEKALAFRDSLNKAISNNVEQAIEMMDSLYKEMSETLRQIKIKERQETLRVAEEAKRSEGWFGRLKDFITRRSDIKKYPESVQEIFVKARKGDPYNQAVLGWMYQTGEKIEQSKGLSLYWFRKASEGGNLDAKVKLGLDAYEFEEYADAAKYFSEALDDKSGKINQGLIPFAQLRLGDCYYNGYGVKQDQDLAIKLYRAAASSGNSVAQIKLKNALKEKNNQASKNKTDDEFGFVPDPVKSALK